MVCSARACSGGQLLANSSCEALVTVVGRKSPAVPVHGFYGEPLEQVRQEGVGANRVFDQTQVLIFQQAGEGFGFLAPVFDQAVCREFCPVGRSRCET